MKDPRHAIALAHACAYGGWGRGAGMRVPSHALVADDMTPLPARHVHHTLPHETHAPTHAVTDGLIRRESSLCCGLPPGSMLRAQAAPKPLPVPAPAAPPQMASPTKHEAVRPSTEQ